jgi:hypothetical protein
MKLKRGQFGYYELPAFAHGCEHPYISKYDEKNNCFLVTLNIAVSRWYTEEVLTRILSRIDIDGTIEELKNNLMRGSFDNSVYPSYVVKCPFRCDFQLVACELCDMATITAQQ